MYDNAPDIFWISKVYFGDWNSTNYNMIVNMTSPFEDLGWAL